MNKENTFNHETSLKTYTELMRLISVGAYEERQPHHYASGTWPDDGVEQGIRNLDIQARRHDLEFAWNGLDQQWCLQHIDQETMDYLEAHEEQG